VISPKRASGEHLKTLARVSRLLRNKDFRERLLHAGDGQEVFKLLLSEEEAGK
jgi:PTS system nitrogen regulatory IIA component